MGTQPCLGLLEKGDLEKGFLEKRGGLRSVFYSIG